MAWSITKFNAEEIIGLAVEIEKQGQKFYEIAAAQVEDAEVKKIFELLVGEEKQHIADFESLGAQLPSDFVPNESYVGEYGDYIKALIDNHVFNHNNIEKFIPGISVAREALAVAFRFEKDSILIFQELYKVVDDAGKEVLGKLIEQEKQHIKKLATDISEEIIWLTNLVENILDMTRINESHLVIQKENEVVDDVVSEAVSHVERLLRERNFTVQLPDDVIMVPMDGRLIVRVLINLLENAVLHTQPEAAIQLSATINKDNLKVIVSDNGQGIKEELYEKLFEKFVTNDKIVSDGRRGIGLGLANCKALVEAHGGSIWAEANDPQGTRFVFTLPLEHPAVSA